MNTREDFENYYKTNYGDNYLDWDNENEIYIYASTDVIWRAWQEQQKKIDDLEWEVLNYRNEYTFVEQRNEIKKQQKKIDGLRMECEDTALRKASAEQHIERLKKKIKELESALNVETQVNKKYEDIIFKFLKN